MSDRGSTIISSTRISMLTRRCSERNHCPLTNVRFLIRHRIPPDSGVPQTYPMVDEYSAPGPAMG